jgi:DNA-binding CsgD family transcriptional regulator
MRYAQREPRIPASPVSCFAGFEPRGPVPFRPFSKASISTVDTKKYAYNRCVSTNTLTERERTLFDLLIPQRLLLSEDHQEIDPQSLESLGLTKREAEVLFWISQGKRNSEIGQILGARSRTIGKHVEKIFLKLGVETRTAAANMAFKVLCPSSFGNGSSH